MPESRFTLATILLVSFARLGVAATLTSSTEPKRHALLIAGAFSKQAHGHYGHAAELYSNTTRSHLSMVRVCANTMKRHVLEANGVVTDIFQHSWNPEVSL